MSKIENIKSIMRIKANSKLPRLNYLFLKKLRQMKLTDLLFKKIDLKIKN
jgi:hypothetical protein